jgi:DNA-binding NarL/FixJ family response regulator
VTDEASRRATASVVVVDDDPLSVRLIKRILRSGGFGRVLTSTSSADAIQLCREEHPDLLLLDLTMPDPDGFAVLSELEEQIRGEPPLRVLILSGHEHPAISRRALDLGAMGAIGKTGGRDQLLAKLDEILAG